VWGRGVAFADQEGGLALAGLGGLRVYDPRAQRRPVAEVPLGSQPLTALLAFPEERSVVVADTLGNIQRVCLRQRKAVGAYKGKVRNLKQRDEPNAATHWPIHFFLSDRRGHPGFG
jgi:hypothetical protein